MKVSKLDAARRQLDGAIQLWFTGGDPVVIHTLVCAAQQIINDINQKQGDQNSLLIEFMRSAIKPEYVEEAMQSIKKPMTFFKHANRDPHDILDFNPELSECFMIVAIKGLESLGEKFSDVQTAFIFWTRIHKPHLFKDDDLFKNTLPANRIKDLRNWDKREFLELFLQAYTSLRLSRKR